MRKQVPEVLPMIRPMIRLLACAVVGVVAWLGIVSHLIAGHSMQILAAEPFDLVIRGGTIYDGRGGAPRVGDVAIRGDKIVALGDVGATPAKREISARGLAVAPGF